MPISERFIRGREPNYVRALEARVEKLEKQLHYARSQMSSQSQPGPDPATAPGPLDPETDDWGPDRRDSLDNIRVNVARRAARLHGDEEIEQVIASLSSVYVFSLRQLVRTDPNQPSFYSEQLTPFPRKTTRRLVSPSPPSSWLLPQTSSCHSPGLSDCRRMTRPVRLPTFT